MKFHFILNWLNFLIVCGQNLVFFVQPLIAKSQSSTKGIGKVDGDYKLANKFVGVDLSNVYKTGKNWLFLLECASDLFK